MAKIDDFQVPVGFIVSFVAVVAYAEYFDYFKRMLLMLHFRFKTVDIFCLLFNDALSVQNTYLYIVYFLR